MSWLLLFLSISLSVKSPAEAFKLTECNNAGNFDIVQNTQPSLTCTGLGKGHKIYWSITDPSHDETRIGECRSCTNLCQPCQPMIEGFNISRKNAENTTLLFLDPSKITSDSTVKCSSFNNNTDTTCRLFVIPEYRIPQCKENKVTIVDGMNTPIPCEGLLKVQNMYWTIAYVNSTVETVANCNACSKNTCPNCSTANDDFIVSRDDNSSTLVIQNEAWMKDGATLTCSKKDGVTQAACKIRVEYKLPQCNSWGNFDIVQNTQPSLTCTGLNAGHSIYWSITDPLHNIETMIGECGTFTRGYANCSSSTGFKVSRTTHGNTTLQFLNSSQIPDGSTIKCSSVSNHSKDSCRLYVIPAYNLPTCGRQGYIVVTNRHNPVRCEGLQSAQSMYWTITFLDGTVSTIADCKACGRTCQNCTIENDDFTVTRQHNSSTLMIKRKLRVRQKDGATLTCSKKDNVTRDGCRVRIEYPGDLEVTNVALNANWTVTGRVGVVKAFVSDPNITCVWYNSVVGKENQLSARRIILQPYNDSTNGLTYFNGSCDLVAKLNSSMTGRSNITVKTLPGRKPVTAGDVNAEKPGALTLDNSTCVTSVTEGSNVTCTCQYENGDRGYPPGRISWTEGAGSAVLELQNVNQVHSGVVFVCRSLWGPHDELMETLNYSVIVNYQASSTGVPVAGVVGGVVVVVIVAVVVVIAVIVRRKKSAKEGTNGRQDTVSSEDEFSEFEEHNNEFYQSADNLSLTTRNSPQSPASLAFVNSSFRRQGAAPTGPEDSVYAQVNKERKGDKPELDKGNEGQQPCTGERCEEREERRVVFSEQGAVYANCDSETDKDNSASNVYMNTDESSALASSQGMAASDMEGVTDIQDPDPNTYYNIAMTQTKGDYTNTMLSGADEARKADETDAEYNHLQFSRPQQLAKDPTYNHLTKL